MSDPPPALGTAQAWLQGAIMADRPPPAADIAARLTGSAGFAAAAGLAIYRRAFVARIAGAMRAQFPALCHALGEGLFNDFVAEYVRLYPPETYTLHDLGRRFSAFLAEQRPDRDAPEGARETWIDFMLDLARFERQLFVLFDAPGAEGRALAEPDATDEMLRLQPALALGRFDYNVADYYHAVQRGAPPPAPAFGANHLALVRSDYRIRTVPLSGAEFVFLEAMVGRGTVADGLGAVAAALAISTEAAAQAWRAARQTRARWIGWGFFLAGDEMKGSDPPRAVARGEDIAVPAAAKPTA